MKKITYTTPYADGSINGYVMAQELGKQNGVDIYGITQRQYKRCFENLTIGGVSPRFNVDWEAETVVLLDKDGGIIRYGL